MAGQIERLSSAEGGMKGSGTLIPPERIFLGGRRP
jgi:hypothetical protein